MGNKPGYFKSWYDENKDELAAKRKQRYEDDPEYRQQVVDQSRKYRKGNRDAPRVRLPRHQVPKEHALPDGSVIKLYSVGAFALYVRRSVQSINHWQREGLLPMTPYRAGKRGFRLYTKEMMDVVREIVGDKRRIFPVDPNMGSRIKESWAGVGVPVDCTGGLEEALEQTKS